MRLRLVGVLSLVGFFLLVPAPVLADHCGAGANVSPPSGPPGATFVFSTNLGARSDLYLYRNGHLVATAFLDNDDFVSYRIKTGQRGVPIVARGPNCHQSMAGYRLGSGATSRA